MNRLPPRSTRTYSLFPYTALIRFNLHELQLHGKETPERVAAIRARHGRETWKAVAVKTRTDLNEGLAYSAAADLLLYDAKTPEGADLPGGMRSEEHTSELQSLMRIS